MQRIDGRGDAWSAPLTVAAGAAKRLLCSGFPVPQPTLTLELDWREMVLELSSET